MSVPLFFMLTYLRILCYYKNYMLLEPIPNCDVCGKDAGCSQIFKHGDKYCDKNRNQEYCKEYGEHDDGVWTKWCFPGWLI